ncbi:MAG: winged helix-turn-helix transcriptional regulator [Candidatus Kerfeldbacteria bacterium]|nr:winged helix-turn-helix transcriptional regulator [Candidatus Kerfeldbacteria bacterium]
MLEQLFGSRTRVKLLRLMLANPQEEFFVRELTRKIDERINSVRRELGNLELMGLVTSHQEDQKKFYRVDTHFLLYDELRSLVLKSHMTSKQHLIQRLKSVGKIQKLILTGIFTGVPNPKTDVLIVGTIAKNRIQDVMKDFGKSFGRDINYTVMTPNEYQYRKDITDKFLYYILENKHNVMIDEAEQTPR